MQNDNPTAAVITVGGGRGFIIECDALRLVITASHCLPVLPPCGAGTHVRGHIYPALLGRTGGKRMVSAECLFANPVADIAVLGPPGYPILSPEDALLSADADAFNRLVSGAASLSVGDAGNGGAGWITSPEGRWFQCVYGYQSGALWVYHPFEGTLMSGSPILAGDKSTIGVICNGMVGHGPSGPHTPLIDQLPLWLLRFLCVLDRSDPAVKLAAIEPEPPISDDSV